ncbi:MAG: hypothetical protein IJO72_02670 [Oscillospiraceae bacterium]|nr:hypothetical protein [Oscillospiraceae bacterium]
MAQTKELLIQHVRAYPRLQIQDIFKFIHQSAFGCEHLVTSLENATARIESEFRAGVRQAQIEPLDGAYCRVPLWLLKGGLQAETLGRLFVLSARQEENGRSALQKKLKIAGELVREGVLPFDAAVFEAEAARWEAEGYPAVRHSGVFREAYHPAYRVIASQFIPFLPLLSALDKLPREKRTVIAIDGGSGSGKTTLSRLLQQLYPCTVFHMDDFFLRPEQRTAERYAEIGGNVDRERVLAEILLPLERGETITYRSFDCATMTLGDAKQVSPQKLVILEGAYAMHPALAEFYDFSVFLDIDPALQRQRILHRNGSETAQRFFTRWIPLENAYFDKTGIKQRCDMTIQI